MRTVGAFEAKNKLSELLDEVERGGEVVITRHGKPVTRLVASETKSEEGRKHEAVENLRALRKSLRERGVTFSVEESLALRDKGRR
jgi:prevent-host-death family protein